MTFKEPLDQYIGQTISRVRENLNINLHGVAVSFEKRGEITLVFRLIRVSDSGDSSFDKCILMKNRLGEFSDDNVSARPTGPVFRRAAIRGIFEARNSLP